MSTPLKRLILVFLLSLASIYVILPQKFSLFGKNFTRYDLNLNLGPLKISRTFDFHLGLDIAGGSQLIFEADTSNISPEQKKTALESVRDIIEKRVNLFGVSEPTVQTSSFEGKDRIIVDLPGIKDTASAIKLIGQTAQLQFAEVVEIPGKNGASPSATLKPTDLTGADLQKAQVVFDPKSGKPSVSIQFTQDGGEKFAKLTKANINKPIAIILDGAIISAPIVQQEIVGGIAQITGNFTLDAAKNLAIELNAGALPVPIRLVQETTLGATLGALSINKSVVAGLVGFSMVLIFMIISYGKLGLVADIGLFLFGIITMALYKVIPVTITLPGIAGFMLSVGMAVDGNILIFERLKEERRRRDLANALEISFGRAWNSIRDAYVATLITCFVLINPFDWQFLNTSGPVRGFAITLALGIFISFITGIVFSRNLLRVFIKK